MFTDVSSDGTNLTLTLANGTTVVVPITKELLIDFDQPTNVSLAAGSSISIGYTITSVTGNASIEVLPTSGIKARVVENGLSGRIENNVVVIVDISLINCLYCVILHCFLSSKESSYSRTNYESICSNSYITMRKIYSLKAQIICISILTDIDYAVRH